ncbi:hypothetical protein lerEdw1_009981 [Lerista edwardsae]|nr:hypothetical protein lerEdw1_009981 [Lerista edwardsae]
MPVVWGSSLSPSLGSRQAWSWPTAVVPQVASSSSLQPEATRDTTAILSGSLATAAAKLGETLGTAAEGGHHGELAAPLGQKAEQISYLCTAGHRLLIPLQPQIMSNNMAKIAEARKTVEQLKLEVNIDRMKAAADLLAHCEAHAKEDPLVTPVPSSENPFREKRLFCIVL